MEEVRALLALDLDPALPAMRAHGVPELVGHLRGILGLAAAAQRAGLATGQYAKRQATWFKHHRLAPLNRNYRINARYGSWTQFSERELLNLETFLDR